MSEDDTEQDDGTHYHAPGSRVAHKERGCHHLDNANDVEELDADEAENYRTCRQCWYNDLSHEEKVKRRRESRRKRRSKKITVRYRR